MGSITLRVRSVVWFATGALLATSITLMFVNAWRVDAAPGDTDSTYVPITPCRLADTRAGDNRVGPSGTLTEQGTVVFQAIGTNGRCAIPGDAVGLSMNVTALGATVLTFLTIWGDGDRPTAASLNPAPGQPPTPNAVTTPLSGAGTFSVYNEAGAVNVVIDVVGYHTESSLRELAQRLADVEAAQTAGADPELLNRLDSLEASAATNATDIAAIQATAATNATDIAAIQTTAATNASAVSALNTTVAANAGAVAALGAAQPFAVSARDGLEVVENSAEVVVAVDVTAPVDGQVTVFSNTNTEQLTQLSGVSCSITTGTAYESEYLQWWDSGGYPEGGYQGVVAGSRVFAASAGIPVTYNLVCIATGSYPYIELRASVVTAIFTPAP